MSEELTSKLNSLMRRFDDVEDKARLNDVSGELNDLGTAVRSMPADVEAIRARGYAFRSYLENKAKVFQRNWGDIRLRAERAIDDERRHMRDDVDAVEEVKDRAERYEDHPEKLEVVLDPFENELDDFERKVAAAQRRVQSMYETLKKDVDATVRQIAEINWFCDVKDEASFPFLANEALFLVATAEWIATGRGKQDPDGYLFLTDQRLLFEQNEKVGKKLGMFGGKKVQELEWEIPLHQVEAVEFENKGMFGGKDILHFTLKAGAPYPKISVEVKGRADNKFWVKQIQRMIAGGTDDERAIAPDPEVVERLREAPTECHVCGATLPMLVAGQNQIECEYCGSVIRI